MSCESDHFNWGGRTSPVLPPLHSNRNTSAVNEVDDGVNRSAVLQTAGAPVTSASSEPQPTSIAIPIIATAENDRHDTVATVLIVSDAMAAAAPNCRTARPDLHWCWSLRRCSGPGNLRIVAMCSYPFKPVQGR